MKVLVILCNRYVKFDWLAKRVEILRNDWCVMQEWVQCWKWAKENEQADKKSDNQVFYNVCWETWPVLPTRIVRWLWRPEQRVRHVFLEVNKQKSIDWNEKEILSASYKRRETNKWIEHNKRKLRDKMQSLATRERRKRNQKWKKPAAAGTWRQWCCQRGAKELAWTRAHRGCKVSLFCFSFLHVIFCCFLLYFWPFAGTNKNRCNFLLLLMTLRDILIRMNR